MNEGKAPTEDENLGVPYKLLIFGGIAFAVGNNFKKYTGTSMSKINVTAK